MSRAGLAALLGALALAQRPALAGPAAGGSGAPPPAAAAPATATPPAGAAPVAPATAGPATAGPVTAGPATAGPATAAPAAAATAPPASAAADAATSAPPAPAAAATTAPGPAGAARTAPPKKDAARAAKSPRHGAPPAPGTRPEKLVNLYNFWTKEWLAIDAAAPPSQATIDRFLRDRFTNKPRTMEPRLIGMLVAAATRFHSGVVEVVSGFRHPKYNLVLRKKGHQVARDSQHSQGNAIDFFVPGVTTRVLHAWAKAQRIGGVGLYPESGFVHMDTGPIRYWAGE